MKIDITKKEYRSLVDLLEIANWVLNAHSDWDREEVGKYHALIQKIYAYAKEMECGDILEYSEKLAGYFATAQYEEKGAHRRFIDEFEEDSFWNELSHKLAFRDVIQQEGETALEEMNFMERATKLREFLSWYEEEFNDNGLANVRVVQERSNKVN
uniref:Uncharacterized protein n=1 Tax=Candidatus Kentrum eta TaxID=2126337 RepID=A0A450ULS7_9GAMM|nr:MAG: hypothetical protein BECKH772A_GA0070896_1005711 [Candidatus Kentron sp. H]VFJ94305.1 MAG: hypothetical protein BECKH772B_GA0070898_1005910 [Candidatus Kentron sp. H]VFK00933.1 MAG: hypothetical protein BECKH772C_GA0070978_1005511 [Candidatus Kentron sp. H]